MTNQAAKQLGKLGGRRTLRKYGVDHFKRISRLAVLARQAKASQTPKK